MQPTLYKYVSVNYALPAVVGGDDHCIAHTGSSQAVPKLMEKPMEQRLQGQDQEEHTHEDTARGLGMVKQWSSHMSIKKKTNEKDYRY